MEDTVAETTFKERLSSYSLSELEDVLAHLDRDAFPDRQRLVTQEIESRLATADLRQVTTEMEVAKSPSFQRRLGASLVDLSIQVVIPYIVLYFVVKVIYTPLGKNWLIQYLFPPEAPQAGRGRRGRGESNDIWSDVTGVWDSVFGFVKGVAALEPEAISTLVVVAEYLLVYLLFRMFWTCSKLAKSGATPGMQELGLKLQRTDGGALTLVQAVVRFLVQHVLFVVTLGVSGLWMFWDKEKRALHDRILGTVLKRVLRSWEKPNLDRKFD